MKRVAKQFACFVLLMFAGFFQNVFAQKSLIGTTKQRPAEWYGCYFTLPRDFGKMYDVRPYLFFSNDDGAIMNVEGGDVALKYAGSYEIKPLKKKKRFVWIYKNENITAKFNLLVTGYENEGSDAFYNASITVVKGSSRQTMTAKCFCGG